MEPSSKRRNRQHSNSKNGCLQCKARKVKCDEEKPKCRACTRRQTPCTYTHDGLEQLASAANITASPFERRDHNFSFTPIQAEFGSTPQPRQESSASFTPPRPGNQAIIPKHESTRAPNRYRNVPSRVVPQATTSMSLNLGHLELLHHFILVTSGAISAGGLGQDLWCTTIPRIALPHDWLMHSLLAISSLHIAHLQPEQQGTYWKRAALHQDQALLGQQKAMANPTSENGDALFAFTLVIIYLSFASARLLEDTGDNPLQAVIRCLHMLRGSQAIGPAVKHFVEGGPLSHLLNFQLGNVKTNPTFKEPGTEAHFSKLLVFCSTNTDLNEQHDMNDVESYASAASSLRVSFLKVEAIPDDQPNTLPVWHWAVRLHAAFVARLEGRHVVPLVLVAHWCVLLAHVQHHWWIQGWVEQTMDDIAHCLPQEHHEWLAWPNEQMHEIKRMRAEKGG